ncbi:MAG: hypothetical protein AUG88_04730 [Actinobacteria bacterium 13_1_20CM_4_68_12]|nr:MAG: hypothetical protein AUG88_04730 [Actinobacteria bacterium 13_1_20CM_4_68_12]
MQGLRERGKPSLASSKSPIVSPRRTRRGVWKRTTPEERARWLANHERLERALARWFRREGVSREEAIGRLRDAN